MLAKMIEYLVVTAIGITGAFWLATTVSAGITSAFDRTIATIAQTQP